MVAKKSVQRLGFKTGEYIVYPAHGVGMPEADRPQRSDHSPCEVS